MQKIQKCNEKKMVFVQKIVTNSIVFLFQGDIQLLYHKNLIHEMNLLLLLSTSIQNKTKQKFSNKQTSVNPDEKCVKMCFSYTRISGLDTVKIRNLYRTEFTPNLPFIHACITDC